MGEIQVIDQPEPDYCLWIFFGSEHGEPFDTRYFEGRDKASWDLKLPMTELDAQMAGEDYVRDLIAKKVVDEDEFVWTFEEREEYAGEDEQIH